MVKSKNKNITISEKEIGTLIKDVLNELKDKTNGFEEGKLNEQEINKTLRKYIKLHENINEEVVDFGGMKIPVWALKQVTRDLRFSPSTTRFGDILSDKIRMVEAVGDILPPDETLNKLRNKYAIPSFCTLKVEHYNEIFVYIVVAKIGENEERIETDMKRMGYFLSTIDEFTFDNITYIKMQFEPTSQNQEDITDKVKDENVILYHWTPLYSLESILKNGLTPRNDSGRFKYPNRIYLMRNTLDMRQISELGQLLYISNHHPQNNGEYALLAVDITNLDDSIRFYYDPNSEIGVYTEQPIPKKDIRLVQTNNFGLKTNN